MKSMLHQASSIQKAIEKAWIDSGKPTEFSIKILERGKQGILWFLKKPSIISITFDPQRQIEKKFHKTKKEIFKKGKRPKKQLHYSDTKKEKVEIGKRQYTKTKERPLGYQGITSNRWLDEYVSYIAAQLKEICEIMNIDIPFNTTIEKKILNIIFVKNMLPAKEDEKLFFISLSYLLLQFLKKKYKKKLKGFQIILKCKGIAGNDKH